MNWTTKEQAAEAAKQGKIPALECSLLHWQQPGMVGYVELAEAIKDGRFHVGPELCACCQKYDACKCQKEQDCPLMVGGHCCNNTYHQVVALYEAVVLDNYSNANMQAFQDAAAEVCKFIADVLEKEKAKEKKKCEPELQHGDVRLWGIGDYLQEFIVDLSDDGINCLWANGDLRNKKSEREIQLNSIFLCNIFDDLKKNSEDLREFEVNSSIYHNKFSCGFSSEPEHPIWLTIKEGGTHHVMHVTLTGITEIHQKLGRIVAFAKRQENKK